MKSLGNSAVKPSRDAALRAAFRSSLIVVLAGLVLAGCAKNAASTKLETGAGSNPLTGAAAASPSGPPGLLPVISSLQPGGSAAVALEGGGTGTATVMYEYVSGMNHLCRRYSIQSPTGLPSSGIACQEKAGGSWRIVPSIHG